MRSTLKETSTNTQTAKKRTSTVHASKHVTPSTTHRRLLTMGRQSLPPFPIPPRHSSIASEISKGSATGRIRAPRPANDATLVSGEWRQGAKVALLYPAPCSLAWPSPRCSHATTVKRRAKAVLARWLCEAPHHQRPSSPSDTAHCWPPQSTALVSLHKRSQGQNLSSMHHMARGMIGPPSFNGAIRVPVSRNAQSVELHRVPVKRRTSMWQVEVMIVV